MKTVFTIIMLSTSFAIAVSAFAMAADSKLSYTASNDLAARDYAVARARCDGFTGNPKALCVAEAKAARVFLEANATAQYKNNIAATTDARKAIAEADHDVERARCDSQAGNRREVCIEEAKANLVAAVADAVADRKVVEARNDASEDKRSADYKVAMQRCDAYAGDPRHACVADVKNQFGK